MRSIVAISSLVLAACLIPASQSRAAEAVSVPRFNAVSLKGGGTVRIVPGTVQRVTIRNGSSAYTSIKVRHTSLEIENCHVRCPDGYRLDLEIQTPKLDAVAVSHGGELRFGEGFGPQGDIAVAVSNGGKIDLRSLRAREVSAAVNSGGAIEVGAPVQLSAAVNSGGAIRYRGNPNVSSAVSSGGSVERVQ